MLCSVFAAADGTSSQDEDDVVILLGASSYHVHKIQVHVYQYLLVTVLCGML